MLHRRQNKQDKRAFPDDLLEWKHLDVTAAAWLIRHLSKDAMLVNNEVGVRSASGLVIALKPQRREVLEVVYIPNPTKEKAEEQTMRLAKERWHHPTFGAVPAIRQGGTGTAIVSVSLRGPYRLENLFLLFTSRAEDFILWR